MQNHATPTHCNLNDSWVRRGNLTKVVASGLTTNFEYDKQGNVVRTWGASPAKTESVCWSGH